VHPAVRLLDGTIALVCGQCWARNWFTWMGKGDPS
jgi:hypothetical protein